MTEEKTSPSVKGIRRIGKFVLLLLGLPFILWAAGAIWFDMPVPVAARAVVAILFLCATCFLWFFAGARPRLAALLLLVVVMGWWFSLSPRGDRDWVPDVERTASAQIQGDDVVFNNVRNCDYRTEADYTARWETRTVHLSKITGIDIAINYWGSPYMAHPIVSFQFSDSPPLCFSIETRKEKGEAYSAIGGIYRQYELIYIVADERDVIRVRTNFRKGEDIYLYRLNISPEKARGRLMDYITALNQLHETPKWYNALTTNCTTSIRTQHDSAKRSSWDWRIIVNGKGDEMLYEKGAIRSAGLPFSELKSRSLINAAAQAAGDDPDFSIRIRENAPSFLEPVNPQPSTPSK